MEISKFQAKFQKEFGYYRRRWIIAERAHATGRVVRSQSKECYFQNSSPKTPPMFANENIEGTTTTMILCAQNEGKDILGQEQLLYQAMANS